MGVFENVSFYTIPYRAFTLNNRCSFFFILSNPIKAKYPSPVSLQQVSRLFFSGFTLAYCQSIFTQPTFSSSTSLILSPCLKSSHSIYCPQHHAQCFHLDLGPEVQPRPGLGLTLRPTCCVPTSPAFFLLLEHATLQLHSLGTCPRDKYFNVCPRILIKSRWNNRIQLIVIIGFNFLKETQEGLKDSHFLVNVFHSLYDLGYFPSGKDNKP